MYSEKVEADDCFINWCSVSWYHGGGNGLFVTITSPVQQGDIFNTLNKIKLV